MADAGSRALRAGMDALGYITRNLASPDPEERPGMRCFVSERSEASSGSTALAALAIAQLPDPASVADEESRRRVAAFDRNGTLRRTGECLLSMIDPDGAVFANYREAVGNERVVKEPLYYPGEVALALVRSYRILGDDRLLEGAVRIADRQRGIYSVSLALDFPWPGDHWIIQALAELAPITDDAEYARLAVLMGQGYVREQYPPQAHLWRDYAGAYRRIVDVPRTTRAASRGEALTAALAAARFAGEDPAPFERALLAGARHLVEQQFTEESSYFVPASWDVLGGIRMGLVDNHLRIDNNQHAIVGMLGALEVLSATP
jgi:hypothetical protein